MKQLNLIFLMLFTCLLGWSQNSNVILFTEGGEPFYVMLNGQQINGDAATNLKIEDLTDPAYKLRVVFQDETKGEMNKTLYTKPAVQVTYNIKLNRKFEWKLGYVSESPISQAPPAEANTTVINYGNPQLASPRSTTTVVEQTTTTTGSSGTTGEKVNMSMTLNGVGMDVNVNDGGGSNVNSTTTTTTTTTTNESVVTEGNYQPMEEVEVVNCPGISDSEYRSAQVSIRNKSFSDSKMTLAKQILKGNCMTAIQIKGLLDLFDFESDRLELAKFAYLYCLNTNNYYKVNDAFEFESSIEELDAYISAQR